MALLAMLPLSTGHAFAAGPGDGPARALPQPASASATPRLRLPTDTPAPGTASPDASASPELSRVVSTPRPAGEAVDDEETAVGAASATVDPGVAAAAPIPGDSPPSGAPPSRPGSLDGPAPMVRLGPSGLVGPPVEDPGIRRVWARSGSPRAGQTWMARLTEGRPAPWRWGLTYLLLGAAFAGCCRQAWRALGGPPPDEGGPG